jgi:hypothetical protein
MTFMKLFITVFANDDTHYTFKRVELGSFNDLNDTAIKTAIAEKLNSDYLERGKRHNMKSARVVVTWEDRSAFEVFKIYEFNLVDSPRWE